jgi:hypothetical protein
LLGPPGIGEALMKPGAKLLRAEITVRTPPAGDHHARRRHTGEPGKTDQFPGHPHGRIGYAS